MNIDVSPDQLSIVIGKIYDSAIEPALWPDALEACCGLIGATLGAINLYDLEDQKKNFTARWAAIPTGSSFCNQVRQTGPVLGDLSDFPSATSPIRLRCSASGC